MLTVFEPTKVEEFQEIVKEFGIKTSVEDPLPAKLVQQVLDVLLPVNEVLINESLAEGNLNTAKCSVIDRSLKKLGLDIDIVNHFRTINNLIFFSKLIERVVKRKNDI